MADNPFSSAPSNTGGLRGISRQIAAVMVGRNALGGKNSNYREQSALNEQQHTQKVQQMVVGHVLGKQATGHAERTKRREGVKKSRAEHTLGQRAADAAHQRSLADREHAANILQSNKPEGTSLGSISVPGASANYKASAKNNPGVGKQFTGSSDTSSLPNVQLD